MEKENYINFYHIITPDQRIAEDVRLLIESSLTLVISFLRSLLTIVSFVTILWTLSGTLMALQCFRSRPLPRVSSRARIGPAIL